MAERAQQLTGLHRIGRDAVETISAFLDAVPESDRSFFKEEIDAQTAERWCSDERAPRWVVMGEDGEAQAILGLVPGTAWSAHVGEVLLIVGAGYRRRGLGRRLARFALTEGVRMGLRKLVVEVVSDKEGDLAMFTSIGFEPEALLRDHICDRDGNLRDLVLLTHDVESVSGAMQTLGLEEAVTE